MLDAVFFYIFAALAILGAILTVTLRNAVHCALSLIGSLAGIAGLYLVLHAEYLFVVQIILYIGGVMVLFLFVIMLVNLDDEAKKRQYHKRWPIALACIIATGGVITFTLLRGVKLLPAPAAADASAPVTGNTEAIADVLFRSYLVPFEVASLLLLVAIVGGVLMGKKRA